MGRNTFGQKIRTLARYGQKALKTIGSYGAKLYHGIEKTHDIVGAIKPLGEMTYALGGTRLAGHAPETVRENLNKFNENYNTVSDFRNRVEHAKYNIKYPGAAEYYGTYY